MAEGIPESVHALGLPEEEVDYDPDYDNDEELEYAKCIKTFSNPDTGMRNYLSDLLLHEAYRRRRTIGKRRFVPAPQNFCWPVRPEDLETSLLVVRRPPVVSNKRDDHTPLYFNYLRRMPRKNSEKEKLKKILGGNEIKPAPESVDMLCPDVADLDKEFMTAPRREVPMEESYELYLALEDCVSKLWEPILKEYLDAHPLTGTAEERIQDMPVLDRYLMQVVAVRCQKMLAELLTAMLEFRTRVSSTTYGRSCKPL